MTSIRVFGVHPGTAVATGASQVRVPARSGTEAAPAEPTEEAGTTAVATAMLRRRPSKPSTWCMPREWLADSSVWRIKIHSHCRLPPLRLKEGRFKFVKPFLHLLVRFLVSVVVLELVLWNFPQR